VIPLEVSGHGKLVAKWRFQVRRGRDRLYRFHLNNPAGTEVWTDAEGYATLSDAKRAAEQTRERLAKASITNKSPT
jgi:hypothetical protein